MASKPAVISDPGRGREATNQAPATGMTPDVMAEMLLDFLKRRGISSILLGLVVGALAGYGAFLLLPVTYKAVAKVQIIAPEGEVRPEVFKGTQIQRINSDKVLNDALSRPEAIALPFVQNNPAHLDVLRSWLKCESLPDSQIVDITLTGVDPVQIKVLVNAVMQAYIAQAGNSMNEQTRLEILSYTKEKDRLEKEIADFREQQKKKANDAGHNDPRGLREELQTIQKNIAAINGTLTEISRKIPRLEDEIKLKRAAAPILPPAALALILQDTQLPPMQKELQSAMKAAKEQLAASKDGVDDPTYQQMLRTVQQIEARIKARREQIELPFLEQVRATKESELLTLEAELRHVNEDREAFETRRFPLDRSVQKLSKAANEIDSFSARISQDEESLKDVGKKLQQLSLQSDAKHITIVDEAQVPRLPAASSKRLAMIGGAGFAGFALVLLLFWLLDFRLKLVSRPEHVQRLLSVPVIGILPKIPSGKRLPDDSDFTGPKRIQRMWHAMHEAINSLRITLMFAPDRRGAGLTTLMITSPRDGEGKSTLTANLAVSLARSGVRVAVIEADMYRPTMFSTFKIERAPGLSDFLRDEKSLDDILKPTEYPNLELIPAGTETQNADTLLNSDRLKKLFDDLQKRGYQTILVDAPPVLPVCDALLLGQQVEQTLLCALCNHSQFYSLRQAQDRLENIGVHVLGVVVAGTPATQKYGYYDYKGYKSSSGTVIPPRAGLLPTSTENPPIAAIESNGHANGVADPHRNPLLGGLSGASNANPVGG